MSGGTPDTPVDLRELAEEAAGPCPLCHGPCEKEAAPTLVDRVHAALQRAVSQFRNMTVESLERHASAARQTAALAHDDETAQLHQIEAHALEHVAAAIRQGDDDAQG